MFRYLRRLLAQDNADSCPESVPKGAENDLETPVLALAALSNCVSHLFYFIASSLVIFFLLLFLSFSLSRFFLPFPLNNCAAHTQSHDNHSPESSATSPAQHQHCSREARDSRDARDARDRCGGVSFSATRLARERPPNP